MKLTKEVVQTLVEMSKSCDYQLFYNWGLVNCIEPKVYGCCIFLDTGKFKYEHGEDAPISVFKRIDLENTNDHP